MDNSYRYPNRIRNDSDQRLRINKSAFVKKCIISICIFVFVLSGSNGYRPFNMTVKTYSNKIMNTDTDINEIKTDIIDFWGKIAHEIGDNNDG